jgi:DNA-binding YbaB/EbfC family protein
MNINALMQQAQKMQQQMQKKQKELESKEFEFTSNGGAIKIKMLGSKEMTSLEIDEDLIDPSEKDMLQDMLIVAINEAISKIEEEASAIMGSMAGGLPGMF